MKILPAPSKLKALSVMFPLLTPYGHVQLITEHKSNEKVIKKRTKHNETEPTGELLKIILRPRLHGHGRERRKIESKKRK